MDAPAPPSFDNVRSIRERIAALEQQTRGLRQDVRESCDLIERLKEHCLISEARLATAENQLALLRTEAERLLKPPPT